MKILIMVLVALNLIAVRAHADGCSDHIKLSVETQADKDLNRKDLVAILPTIDEDGGSVDSYSIPVAATSRPKYVLANYSIVVSENCGIIHLDREQKTTMSFPLPYSCNSSWDNLDPPDDPCPGFCAGGVATGACHSISLCLPGCDDHSKTQTCSCN